jgi:hypothetical protein
MFLTNGTVVTSAVETVAGGGVAALAGGAVAAVFLAGDLDV